MLTSESKNARRRCWSRNTRGLYELNPSGIRWIFGPGFRELIYRYYETYEGQFENKMFDWCSEREIKYSDSLALHFPIIIVPQVYHTPSINISRMEGSTSCGENKYNTTICFIKLRMNYYSCQDSPMGLRDSSWPSKASMVTSSSSTLNRSSSFSCLIESTSVPGGTPR